MKNPLRRLAVVAFWAALGAIAAGIVGALSGHPDRAGGPVVVGINVIAVLLVVSLIALAARSSGRSVGALLRLRPEAPPAPELPRELARIESLRELGVTVRNLHHLYEFVVTVFPGADQEGGARRAEFSQLITMGQLPNFYTGRYVVLATLPGDPPQLRLDPVPSADWALELRAAPDRYDDVSASLPVPTPEPKEEPEDPAPAAGVPVLDHGKLMLNLLLIGLCVAGGFALSTWFITA